MLNERYLKYDIDTIIKEHGEIKVNGLALTERLTYVRDSFTLFPHIMEDFLVALCVKGSAKAKIGLKEHTIVPGTLVSVVPQTLVEPIEASDDLQLNTILFTFDFIAHISLTDEFDIADKVRTRPVAMLSDEQNQVFNAYYHLISLQYDRTNLIGKRDILQLIVLALVSEIKNMYSKADISQIPVTRSEQIANDFFDLIYKHYRTERSASFYANRLNLTPKYLTTVIREETNKSINTWINEAVIVYAKSLLKATDLTIAEIAYELNFTDSSVFCRFFKRYTNTTPNAYRKEA